MIKSWVLQEDVIALNIIHIMKQPQKYTKHILVLKGEIATVGDWEISIHPSHMLIGQMGKNKQQGYEGYWNNTGYVQNSGCNREHTFYSSTRGMYAKINQLY